MHVMCMLVTVQAICEGLMVWAILSKTYATLSFWLQVFINKGIRSLRDETFCETSFAREHLTIDVPYMTINSYVYWSLNKISFFQKVILKSVFFLFSIEKLKKP